MHAVPNLFSPRVTEGTQTVVFDFGEFFYYILELLYMLWPGKKDRKK
jgi:hypothetical protein